MSIFSNERHTAHAGTKKEISELIEAGFEYVCDLNEAKFFRKPK